MFSLEGSSEACRLYICVCNECICVHEQGKCEVFVGVPCVHTFEAGEAELIDHTYSPIGKLSEWMELVIFDSHFIFTIYKRIFPWYSQCYAGISMLMKTTRYFTRTQ